MAIYHNFLLYAVTDWKDHYIGCYEGTKSIKYMADDLEDVETCLILCRNERQKLALIQEVKLNTYFLKTFKLW